MKFLSNNDYQTIVKINKELVNEVLDTTTVIYKLNLEKTKVNSYDEGPTKNWYRGVIVPARIEREDQTPTDELQTVDIKQTIKFHYLRAELQERNIYPEGGDIIGFNDLYYEVNNVNENQLWGGRVEYNFGISCEGHLIRSTLLQLDPPNIV